MIKTKKIDDNTTLYVHEKTNEPIAVARARKSAWSGRGKSYSISWHPTTQALYPAASSLTHRNFAIASSASEAKNMVEGKYGRMMDAADQPDPLKTTEQAGTVIKNVSTNPNMEDNREYTHLFVHHPETDEKIASLYIRKGMMNYVGVNDRDFNHEHNAFIEHHGEAPSEAAKKIMQTKFPTKDPISLLNQTKYWLANKNKEPRFVGHYQGKGSSVYKTKLTPENAKDEFVKHLIDSDTSDDYKTATIQHLSPTIALIKHAHNNSRYSAKPHEIIDSSEPGKLVHSSYMVIPDEKHYHAAELNKVID